MSQIDRYEAQIARLQALGEFNKLRGELGLQVVYSITAKAITEIKDKIKELKNDL